MARARNLKPGFFKNEDLAECSPWARLCFAGLWTLADRDGRLEDRPKRIKGELFAFDSVEVEPLLVELAKHGFVLRYRTADGLGLIQVLKFYKHQNPHHKEPKGALPSPQSLGLLSHAIDSEPEALCLCDEPEAPDKPEALVPIPVIPSTRNRAESKPLIPESRKQTIARPAAGRRGEGRFPDFWQAWPSTERKQDRKKCLEKWHRHGWDDEADAIVAHVTAMKATRKWLDGYEPAPLTYLNNERWRDGVNAVAAADPQWEGVR